MSEWSNYTVGEVAKVFDGPHATPKKTTEGPWFLSISSLVEGRLVLSESAHLSEEDFAKWTRRVTPEPGDILFSYETRLGEAALMPTGVQACLGRRMGLLRPNRSLVVPQFLLYTYLAPAFQETIKARRIHGATVDRIPLVDLPSWPLILPGVPEQKAIVAALGALDGKISVNERIASTAEELILTTASSVRWDRRVRLEEICSLEKEQSSPQEMSVDIVEHYSLPAFDAGRGAERVSPATIKSNKFLVKRAAVLLSKLNPEIPRVWNIKPAPNIPALASTEFLVLTPKSGLSTHGLWSVAAQPDFRTALASKVTGTSKSHQRVRPAEALSTEVVDPRQFGEDGRKIEVLAHRAELARRENRALATLRDTLLPQLMSGRLRVRDAEKIVEDHA
ncbi:restriction endonuclease subunit S [Streptomyces anulatus]|uniref:restriction endonuclease subunit S n=1 Tax=Streptomyces anulatus TaxID=1892 RepID=UPI001674E3BC|nr:restriction endonuclease subunit S [Streptomyces anulatus]GGY44942.1 hypothetical protein GCM10010342_35230 [Streptomyces anulatus]